jgi:beta-hydroxyacyl-ACP dehydratase FabZ
MDKQGEKGGEHMLDITQIMEVLPHRYPFLLIDRILEIEMNKRIVGFKNVTINEPFFQGHFPGHPIMPGVLLLEAMAQTGGVLALKSIPAEEAKKKVIYFMSIDKAKFRKPVLPGDQLRFEIDVIRQRSNIMSLQAVAKVDGATVAEAEMMAMIVDKHK